MRETIIILLCLAIFANAFVPGRERTRTARFGHLKGWQKVFGLIAVILAVFILINPDFLALGLLGDATFFDVLVLALSFQMLVFVQESWRFLSTGLAKWLRWVGIPSPGMRLLWTLSMIVTGSVISSIQKIAHKILS
jgi:hypothetical protein